MPITSKDIVALSQVRAQLTDIADEVVKTGREKIVTRNGRSYIAIVGAERLDYYHQLERENIHIKLLKECEAGLEDIERGRVSKIADLKKKFGR